MTTNIFLTNVAHHKMTVALELGVMRHLTCSSGDNDTAFAITTFPDYLCISGSMGTFCFSGTPDMFDYFRNPQQAILPVEWSTQLVSTDTVSGHEEFDDSRFYNLIKQAFDEWDFTKLSKDEVAEVWRDVESLVIAKAGNGEAAALRAAADYTSDYGHVFTDFNLYNFIKYTFHYLWCLHAIVWAIGVYDDEHATEHGPRVESYRPPFSWFQSRKAKRG